MESATTILIALLATLHNIGKLLVLRLAADVSIVGCFFFCLATNSKSFC